MIDTIKTGKLLKALRKAKGLSVAELSEELNVTIQAVYKWECGRGLPCVDRLVDLSELYGVPMGRLVVRGENG